MVCCGASGRCMFPVSRETCGRLRKRDGASSRGQKGNVLLNSTLRAKANYPNMFKHRFQHNIRKKCVIQQQAHIQNG